MTEDRGEKVIINPKSFRELIKWLIVEYVGVSYEKASVSVEQRTPYFEGINSLKDAYFVGHDWPYFYTAMDIYFGGHGHDIDVFLINERPDAPGGLELYGKIEKAILCEHDLKEPVVWR